LAVKLEVAIRFWEIKLQYNKFFLDPSMVVVLEETIKYLKRLQQIEKQGVSR
jgi:hypothetical protein